MIERYATLPDYCATPAYQQWLTTWATPAGMANIQWVDSESNETFNKAFNHAMSSRLITNQHHDFTPRHLMNASMGTRLVYHLLDSLDMGTLDCVDIGCGHNVFRGHYGGLYGVDPHNKSHRDAQLTPDWYRVNHGKWSHAFSCNAIHFHDQTEVVNQIAKVRDILRPGGTAVIALNRARIQDFTRHYDPELLYDTLGKTPGLTRMAWIDEPKEASMDGNVWLWLRQ